MALETLWDDSLWEQYDGCENIPLLNEDEGEDDEDNEEKEEEGKKYKDMKEDKDPNAYFTQSPLPQSPPPQDPKADLVLQFCLFMATEDFKDGNSKSTMLVYFSAVCGLTLPTGANFLRPAQFTSILSSFIYCTRLLIMESVLPRFSHDYIGLSGRPRYGQLHILNNVRKKKICDGTLSPLGELISLAAYGQSLRRSEGPTIQFEWSDDGEEISWDGCFRVTMDGFRALAHSTIQTATRQCERLMYDWIPPTRDLKTLRDRLSTATAGYSFVSDPANGILNAYLELLTKACLSPVNRLTLIGKNK